MNTKHTPGPWNANSISQQDGSIGISAGRFVIASVYNGVSALDIVFGNEPSAQWANARLIAAAPELLEALQTLAAEEFRDDDDPILVSARAKARAAIAKALGGAA